MGRLCGHAGTFVLKSDVAQNTCSALRRATAQSFAPGPGDSLSILIYVRDHQAISDVGNDVSTARGAPVNVGGFA